MIEPVAIPFLMKAVDFIFGEGSKILEERRERRKAQQEAGTEGHLPVHPIPTLESTTTGGLSGGIVSKQAALSYPVLESSWSDSEARVKHLLSLLEIYTKNYYLAKEQYAKWGSTLVPAIIQHNLTEAENQVAVNTKELQSVLSKVYNKEISAPEVKQA